MLERHSIAGPPSGAPLAASRVGARVRVPLDSPPSPRWSRALSAQLVAGLVGHRAVGHLRLDAVVQGADIVLDGVEPAEAELLGPVLRGAIEAANHACEAPDDEAVRPANMDRREAQRVAQKVVETAQDPPAPAG
jgi:hypothetical protein